MQNKYIVVYRCVAETGCKPDMKCTAWIRQHYVFLLDNLDSVFSGLIDYLYQYEVVDKTEMDEVKTERTFCKQNERLLSIIGRKSPEQIQLFFKALDKTGQRHIRNEITGQQTTAQSMSLHVLGLLFTLK